MLAALSALIAGWFMGWLAAVIGYAAFVVYSYLRASRWAGDPFVQLNLRAGRGMPTEVRIERIAAAILIPPMVAFIARLALP